MPPASRRLVDIAAGPHEPLRTPLTDDDLASAARHGLLGLMALSEDPLLSEPARAPYARLAARQSAMLTVLRPLLEQLAEAAIPATVVKGPSVAAWAYRHPGHRTFTDLDLLVPAERVDQVLAILGDDDHTIAIPPKTPKADKRNIPMVSDSGVRFTLDLHWDLFSYSQLRGCADGAIPEAWERATLEPDSPLGPMWRLPQETLIAFLATHALLDHRFRLILFRDLKEVAEHTEVDWDRYLQYSQNHGLRSAGYMAWLIAHHLLGARIPATTLNSLRPNSLPVAAAETLLPRVDLVTFDGHWTHPLNLAVVLSHDRRLTRLRLAMAAPTAYPEWKRRVAPARQVDQSKRRSRTPRNAGRPNRVLHLLPVDLARGAQTYARAMRDALDGPEVEHRTATLFRSDPVSLEADFDLGVPPGWGRQQGFSLGALRALSSFLRVWTPDLVIAHGGEPLKYAALAKQRGTRVAHLKIGISPQLASSRLRRGFHRALVRRADLVVGVSPEVVEEAQSLLGVPESRTIYIPNGRDPADFRVAAHGIRERPRVVFVGHMTRTKRPELFVAVVEALQERGVETEGWMIGDGPMLEQLQRASPESIRFFGRRPDVPALLSESDIFLFTSVAEGEGMPGVLIEAGFAGLPTVSTDVPGASTVIGDGATGFVVPIDDHGALVEAVQTLAKDPTLRSRMGDAARRRCLDHFTLEGSMDLWRVVIGDLLRTPAS